MPPDLFYPESKRASNPSDVQYTEIHIKNTSCPHCIKKIGDGSSYFLKRNDGEWLVCSLFCVMAFNKKTKGQYSSSTFYPVKKTSK